MKRIAKELQQLQKEPCEGITVIINEENITDVQADIAGPTGTPYEGGTFRMKLCLGADFPLVPPKGFFLTKIFHPNVSPSGEICVNVLKKDWNADMGLRHVLLVIRCLLIEPFPESALNEEAGKLLLDNYEEYARHAKLMTTIHAMSQKRSTPLTASGANSASGETSWQDLSGSPSAKKAKCDKKPSAVISKAKKSLKRL